MTFRDPREAVELSFALAERDEYTWRFVGAAVVLPPAPVVSILPPASPGRVAFLFLTPSPVTYFLIGGIDHVL
jgi:hypothetical protein